MQAWRLFCEGSESWRFCVWLNFWSGLRLSLSCYHPSRVRWRRGVWFGAGATRRVLLAWTGLDVSGDGWSQVELSWG